MVLKEGFFEKGEKKEVITNREVYILAARRTPFGKFWGALKDIPAPRLGAEVIRRILEETGVVPESIDGVYMGEVLTAGVGQNPARQAARHARLPDSCPAETFNKVCSSSLAAIRHAKNDILAGEAHLMIAGGMENMSRAPYVFRRWEKRSGDFSDHELVQQFIEKGKQEGDEYRYMPQIDQLTSQIVFERFIDSMLFDGLRDAYGVDFPHMGKLADMCARERRISRDEQEAYAFASFSRALEAQKSGVLRSQIVPVVTENGVVELDECVYEPDMARWKKSKPAFSEDGTVIAGTSSQISDGAAALLIASERYIKQFKQEPLARIVNFFVYSGDPNWYTTAPVNAIRNLIFKTNAGLPSGKMMSIQDIDLFEINEAFAVVPLFAMRELGIPHEKVNIWGGAIALGHPIGASGARIVGNLVYQLIHTGGRYGIAVACNGGGEAVAVLVENTRRNR